MNAAATLTYTELGVLLNAVGILVALVASLAVATLYRRAFFHAWTLHYVFAAAAIASEFVEMPGGHQSWVALPGAVCYYLSLHYIFRTAFLLRGVPTPRPYWPAMVVILLLVIALKAAGQPFQVAMAPVVVASLVAHGWLGLSLMRLGSPVATGLGWVLLAASAWFLTYPVIGRTSFAWVGFAVSGAFHVLVGIGLAIYVLHDTTSQLRRQHAELQEVDRLKTNFLATMSHELRTPLTVIHGSSQLLRDGAGGPLSEPQQRLMDDLCDHTERMIRLINDLLDFSKMEAGAMTYYRVAEDLGPLVREVTESMRPLFEHAGLTLAAEVPAAPVVAEVDGVKITQVLLNLLSNALKFTHEGGVRVKLTAADGEARLEVRDTGIGIPPDELGRVFGKFYQVDSDSTRTAGGTGLGLAICKAIVEEGHQGRLTAESEPGAGSVFTVTLPTSARTGA